MKKKKILLTTLGFISSATPIVTAISCSNSWTSWDKKHGHKRPTYKFPELKIAPAIKWQVRDIKDIQKAWNDQTQVLDLEKINNWYELIDVIAFIIKFKSNRPIDDYWEEPNKVKQYINNVESNKDIKIKYKTSTSSIIKWNIMNVQQNITSSIDKFMALKTPEEKNRSRAVIIRKDQVYENAPFANLVADGGKPFLKVAAIQGLLSEDGPKALELAKLLNLPKDAFDGILDLFKTLSIELENIFKTQEIQSWITNHKINFTIRTDGKSYLGYPPKDKGKKRFMGQFILRTIKN